MSASDSSRRERLSPRAVRVRNRCLAALAARRSLPTPTDADIAAIGDDVRLSEAWAQWQTARTPKSPVEAAAPSAKRVPTKWRPRMIKISAVAAAAMLGFVVGDRWIPRAAAQSGDIAAEIAWLPVTDSVVTALKAKPVEFHRRGAGKATGARRDVVARAMMDAVRVAASLAIGWPRPALPAADVDG
jgi:hypothetical protein